MATTPEVDEPLIQTLVGDLQKTLTRHIERVLNGGDWEHVKIREFKGREGEVFTLRREVNLGALSQKYDKPEFLHIRDVLIPALFADFYREFEDILYGFDPDCGSIYVMDWPKIKGYLHQDHRCLEKLAIFEIEFRHRETKPQTATLNGMHLKSSEPFDPFTF